MRALSRARREQLKNPLRAGAWRAVYRAVRDGRLPKANSQRCVDCGGKAVHYDHYAGYEREHWLSVDPVCYMCHAARTQRPYTVEREARRLVNRVARIAARLAAREAANVHCLHCGAVINAPRGSLFGAQASPARFCKKNRECRAAMMRHRYATSERHRLYNIAYSRERRAASRLTSGG